MISPLTLPMLSPPGFAVIPEDGDRKLTLRFKGVADMSSIEPLDDYLRGAHREARQRGVETVVVDFRALEFMNSSCFKCFVEWLGSVQDLPAADRYNVVFESNAKMHWQRRSLNALRCFAMDVVSVNAA